MTAIPTNRDARAFGATREAFVRELPGHFERISWSPEQLRAHQTEALRSLLRTALARSPFYAKRLGSLVGDVERFELGDLARLPVMTKAEMMDCYGDVVTDRRLTRSAVDDFLASAGPDPTALFGEYIVLASGGSSGLRGVFAQHLDQVPDYLAGFVRGGLFRATGGSIPRGLPVANVAAASSIHATRATSAFLDGSVARVTLAPVTLALDEIVERVEAAQPVLLVGYPSVLVRLADEQLAGRLSIRPAMVISTSEQLRADVSERISAAFGAPPASGFGSSEGLHGTAPPGDPVFTFASDLAHVEFVDADDQPVELGEVAHHVLVTNLVNTSQPLIRYRLDDRMTQQPALPGIGHVRATLEGRSDEVIRLGDTEVHPIAVRSVFARASEVREYQVRSGDRSLRVDVIVEGSPDTGALARELADSLAKAGASGIHVEVEVVADLERDPQTGKARRFIG